MLVTTLLSTVMSASGVGLSVELLGAQRSVCSAEVVVSAGRADAAECYSINARVPVRVEIRGVDQQHRIFAWRYAARDLHTGATNISGQFIDQKGKEVWREDVKLALVEGKRTPYELTIEIDTDGDLQQRTFYVDLLAQVWKIAGTSIQLVPHGCWHEAPLFGMTLVIEPCESKAESIKAVVVKPKKSLTLQQYVTNSVDVYSQAGLWKVKRRNPLPNGLGKGEMLELEQTIVDERHSIEKFFIQDADKIVIVSRYRQVNETSRNDDFDWIAVDNPD